jgi:hypothetical protein
MRSACSNSIWPRGCDLGTKMMIKHMSSARIQDACRLLLPVVCLLSVAACGGGGASSGPSSPPAVPTPPTVYTGLATLDASNAGKFGGEIRRALRDAKRLSDDVRKSIPPSLPRGTTEGACELGGTLTTYLTNDRLEVTIVAEDCTFPSGTTTVTYNGAQKITLSGTTGDRAFTAEAVFTDWHLLYGNGNSFMVSGQSLVESGARVNGASLDKVTLSIQFDIPNVPSIVLNDIVVEFLNTSDFPRVLDGLSALSGGLTHETQGRVALQFDDATGVIVYSGLGNSVGKVDTSTRGFIATLHESISAPASAFLDISETSDGVVPYYNETASDRPELTLQYVSEVRFSQLLADDTLPFSLRRNFYDANHDMLTVEVVPVGVEVTDRNGVTSSFAVSDPAVSHVLTEVASGNFEFWGNIVEEVTTYSFQATATDANGLVTSDTLEFAIPVYLDTDNDLIGDLFDRDDDNDGVDDFDDPFPTDASETADADSDGIGDNADPDDDNDGVADSDDFYPFDPICYREIDGDGTSCTLRLFREGDTVAIDRNAIAYIAPFSSASLEPTKIHRYDIATGFFDSTMIPDPVEVGLDPGSRADDMLYLESQHALYLLYSVEAVVKIDLGDPAYPQTVIRTDGAGTGTIVRIQDFDPFLVVVEREGTATHGFSYDEFGNLVDSYTLPDAYGGWLFTSPANFNFCESGVTLDLNSGTFVEYSNPGKLACLSSIFWPVPSIDGSRALLTPDLRIVDQSLATVGTVIPQGDASGVPTAFWLAQGIFVNTYLGVEVFDADGAAIGQIYSGSYGVEQLRSTVHKVGADAYVALRLPNKNGIRIERFEAP